MGADSGSVSSLSISSRELLSMLLTRASTSFSTMDSLSKQSEKSILRSLSSALISDSRIDEMSSGLTPSSVAAERDKTVVVFAAVVVENGRSPCHIDEQATVFLVVADGRHHPSATTAKHDRIKAIVMEILLEGILNSPGIVNEERCKFLPNPDCEVSMVVLIFF